MGCCLQLCRYFNSQPHEEADRWFDVNGDNEITNFNSQPHEEADNLNSDNTVYEKVFQLTASRRG